MQLYREMEVGYCRMVSISTDNLVQTMEYRSGVGAHWPFLSDPEGKVLDDLDIAEYTDPIPVSACVIAQTFLDLLPEVARQDGLVLRISHFFGPSRKTAA